MPVRVYVHLWRSIPSGFGRHGSRPYSYSFYWYEFAQAFSSRYPVPPSSVSAAPSQLPRRGSFITFPSGEGAARTGRRMRGSTQNRCGEPPGEFEQALGSPGRGAKKQRPRNWGRCRVYFLFCFFLMITAAPSPTAATTSTATAASSAIWSPVLGLPVRETALVQRA